MLPIQACGFELVFEEAGEGGTTEGFAVLPEHADLDALHTALRLLGQATSTPSQPPQQQQQPRSPPARQASIGTAAASSSGNAAPPRAAGRAQPTEKRPRNTQASNAAPC